FSINSNQQILLEAKERIKARLGLSPDAGDALALTFAEPVRRERRAAPERSDTDYDPLHW
ncbi:MAG TPA: terminase, partial [Kiloniellaceae bacterium]|nr:terminase [Kiloniellaceae bacterium]